MPYAVPLIRQAAAHLGMPPGCCSYWLPPPLEVATAIGPALLTPPCGPTRSQVVAPRRLVAATVSPDEVGRGPRASGRRGPVPGPGSTCIPAVRDDAAVRPENCVTRNHIEVWHERVLPSGLARISFWTVLRGSFLPILVWGGMACFAYVLYHPLVAVVMGGLFATALLVALVVRRKAGHSVRCSLYGAVGRVFDESMVGF